jgi:glycosyltransferase involved in cell wall biosynthesis
LERTLSRRLGLYVDGLFRVEERQGRRRVLTNFETYPFLRFVSEVGRRADQLLFFGRAAGPDREADFEVAGADDLIMLPYYDNVASIGAVLRSVHTTIAAMWRGLARVDVVWVFGPHPFGAALVAMALIRRRRVVLGVRQDSMRYYRARLRRRRGAPLLVVVWMLDLIYRFLARRLPATVVGPALEARYDGPRRGLLAMTVSLVSITDVAPAPPERNWDGTIDLLAVGRVEPEKNPELLLEAIASLGHRYGLTWIGTGRLVEPLRRRAVALGIAERVAFPGYVPFGPALLNCYRRAHMLVHVSLTEGVPQVLSEAAAVGLPVVATDVGGVATALDGAGLVVPPRDRDALVAAIRRMVADPELRHRSVLLGLERARARSLESEAARVAAFILGDASRSSRFCARAPL